MGCEDEVDVLQHIGNFRSATSMHFKSSIVGIVPPPPNAL
jgi:hypothetical protein